MKISNFPPRFRILRLLRESGRHKANTASAPRSVSLSEHKERAAELERLREKFARIEELRLKKNY